MSKDIIIDEEFGDKLIKYINFHYNTHYNAKHINAIKISTYQFLISMKIDADSYVYRIKYDDFSKFNY